MSERKHIASEAAALAALSPMALERLAAEAHGRVCMECSRALREAERVLELLDAHLEFTPPSARSMRQAVDHTRHVVGLRIVGPTLGAALGLAAAIALLGAFPGEGLRWVAAAALGAMGAFLSWHAISGRSIVPTLVAATLLSVVFAAGFAGSGPVAPLLGLRCAAVELVPVVSGILAMLVFHFGLAVRERWRAVALVAASGLCSQAALLVCCPARMGAAHVLLFHSGGLLAMCLIAALIVPRMTRTPA